MLISFSFTVGREGRLLLCTRSRAETGDGATAHRPRSNAGLTIADCENLYKSAHRYHVPRIANSSTSAAPSSTATGCCRSNPQRMLEPRSPDYIPGYRATTVLRFPRWPPGLGTCSVEPAMGTRPLGC